MLRGVKTFVCKDCGHRFKALDMEWNATAASYPVKCPKCGSINKVTMFANANAMTTVGRRSLEALRLQPLGKPPQCFS